MQFSPLKSGKLIQRYKRFLADVELADGSTITLHCPNTGAMTGCAEAGDTVWYSTSDNPKRKYAYTWELTQTKANDFICVNTVRANQLVQEALQNKMIAELNHYSQILPEQKYGEENSRIDFLLKNEGLADCFVEVKSTTLLTENGVGMFPDAKTERGQKHLRELINVVENGQQAVIFFAILHTGVRRFDVARFIDSKYAKLFDEALVKGVQALVYQAKFEFNNGIPMVMNFATPTKLEFVK